MKYLLILLTLFASTYLIDNAEAQSLTNSSEVISMDVAVCMKSSLETWAKGEDIKMISRHCSCLADSKRTAINLRPARVAKTCLKFARFLQSRKQMMVSHTPYHRELNWPSEAVYGAQTRCVYEAKLFLGLDVYKYNSKVSKQCGCSVNLMRLNSVYPKHLSKKTERLLTNQLSTKKIDRGVAACFNNFKSTY